jgi:hypothetical protein
LYSDRWEEGEGIVSLRGAFALLSLLSLLSQENLVGARNRGPRGGGRERGERERERENALISLPVSRIARSKSTGPSSHSDFWSLPLNNKQQQWSPTSEAAAADSKPCASGGPALRPRRVRGARTPAHTCRHVYWPISLHVLQHAEEEVRACVRCVRCVRCGPRYS